MIQEQQIKAWLYSDKGRMQALALASSLNLNDWCIAAGFVRNLVWDKIHGYSELTPLNDIDLIYFDENQRSKHSEKVVELSLKTRSQFPWSVKNQARMHMRNHDLQYNSTSHAMSHWVEIETAIGAKLSANGQIQLVAPFGVEALFNNTITMNPKRPKPKEFERRVLSKQWLKLWPNLVETYT